MRWLACLLVAFPSLAQTTGPRRTSAEDWDARLESVRKALADDRRPLDQRASVALEESAALDRAAQEGADSEERRSLEARAVALLDEFNAAHPGHALATPLAVQAAVYAWADGRRDLEACRATPGESGSKGHAVGRLDDAVARLDRIEPDLSGADPLVAQNAHFRLAQALTDRASLDEDRSDARKDRFKRALAALEPIPAEPSLAGYARMLRAEILMRSGDLEGSEGELERVAKMKDPPPARAVAELRTDVLIARRRFSGALKALEADDLDPVARAAMIVHVQLARRRGGSDLWERKGAEEEAFARVASLRGSPRPEARRAFNELAREVEVPASNADAEAWDLLADGAMGLGQARRASKLEAQGADRAESRGDREGAARFRFKAAAILFQDGDYAGADALLGRVWSDPKAGPTRPKAGMLRALARGRSLAAKGPGASRADYEAALRDQVLAYPDDPSTGEAHWLLGQVAKEDGRVDQAITRWKSVRPSHPRWLAARLEVARALQGELDDLRTADDPRVVGAKYREAASFLRESLRVAPGPSDAIDLDLAMVRLDLTPTVGHRDLARSTCERLAHEAGSPDQHARAVALRIVALVSEKHYGEAELELRKGAAAWPPDVALLAARLIDHEGGDSESENHKLRCGRFSKALSDGSARSAATWPPALQTEAKLRAIRASILAGDGDAARRGIREVAQWDLDALEPDLLRDLTDAFLRLDAYGVAVDVERLRARRLKPGSLRWIESRYLLALALDGSRKPNEAARIIDATAILHADLGGPRLRERFEALRRRIEQE